MKITLVLIFLTLGIAASRTRRLRVKTVANITTSTETPISPTVEINVTTTTVKPFIRRQRLRTTTTTTTTEEASSTTVEPVSQRSRRRFKNHEEPATNGHAVQNTTDLPVAQSAPRELIRPERNSSVYNFETGRLSRRGKPVEKNVDEVVQQETVLTPKRYSSRYSGRARQEASTTETGLLDDGDYRQDSEGAFGQQVEDEETPVVEKEEQKKAEEAPKKETKSGGEEHHADQHAVKGSKDSKGYDGGHKFHKVTLGFLEPSVEINFF